MAQNAFDPIKPWFVAAESLDEYIGIRFGHLHPGKEIPEWIFLRHIDFDGIGGFAEILRRRGAYVPKLAQIKHPSDPSWMPFIKSIPKLLRPRRRLKWGSLGGRAEKSTNTTPPSAVAWHVFDESTTTQVRRTCRKNGFTVNSFLLKHLTKAIRPDLLHESSIIPWMIPVNLRGKVHRERDTENFSSYVGVKVRTYETVQDVHANIYAALGRREHWANWYAYTATRPLGRKIKEYLVHTGQCMPEWYLGAFSNLGDWDPEKKITQSECEGDWVFCPPVLRCQLVGAGCVTFQNRLSLMVQAHPELTTSSAVPQNWIQNWVKEIQMDISSTLVEPVVVNSLFAAA